MNKVIIMLFLMFAMQSGNALADGWVLWKNDSNVTINASEWDIENGFGTVEECNVHKTKELGRLYSMYLDFQDRGLANNVGKTSDSVSMLDKSRTEIHIVKFVCLPGTIDPRYKPLKK
jgi:hypothetical protein